MRIHLHHSSRNRQGSAAFTLVEVLVVIVIIAVLAVFTIIGVKKSMAKAEAAKAISNIRQSGALLLGAAMEKNGRLYYFAGGGTPPTVFEYYPYYVIYNQLGQESSTTKEIMHWNAAKLPGNHWSCRGINFSDNPDFGVAWNNVPLLDPSNSNNSANLKALSIGTVTRPGSFPFLLESSNTNGNEIFRVYYSGTDLPGLRNSGKANACFLDGSARQLGPIDLKKAGFKEAYDNSDYKNPAPKKITL